MHESTLLSAGCAISGMSDNMAVPSWTPWVTWLLLIIAGQLVRWAIRALVSLFRALGVDASYKLTREITVIGAYGGAVLLVSHIPNLPSTIVQTIYAASRSSRDFCGALWRTLGTLAARKRNEVANHCIIRANSYASKSCCNCIEQLHR